MSGFLWEKQDGGFRCRVSETVTLVVTPERLVRGFVPKAARGTKWHAQASRWDETSRTLSRFGRDEYMNLQESAAAAMRLAEDIYLTA